MRAKDDRSYAELFREIQTLGEDFAEYQPQSKEIDDRITNVLTACYWLFRLAKKEYRPLTEWYEQHNKGG